jgi:FKBP-type peptidyl-prolyl cis-trans isomerase FkpA
MLFICKLKFYSMNQKLFLLPLLALIAFAGCSKKASNSCGYPVSTIVATVAEQNALHDSLTAHGITNAMLAPSGFFYSVNQPGSGSSPTSLCSTVAVFYRGGFLNGHGFDSTSTGTPAVFQLGQVIPGWQKALPLVAKGGDITLYIPPSLAYGSTPVKDTSGNIIIPANSNLVFHVLVADVQ